MDKPGWEVIWKLQTHADRVTVILDQACDVSLVRTKLEIARHDLCETPVDLNIEVRDFCKALSSTQDWDYCSGTLHQ